MQTDRNKVKQWKLMYNKNMHWKMRECEKKNHIMKLFIIFEVSVIIH
jgi:hypothetical protein